MQEVENILRILEGTKKAMIEKDSIKIKQLSNQTTNTASQTHDPDNIAIAVIVYSIGKIIEREHYRNLPGWKKFYNNTEVYLNKAISSLKKKDEEGVRQSLESIRKEINNLSGKLKFYIQDVFRKAQINKASKIYEHGISMEKTARLLGITMYELASYAGQADLPKIPGKTVNIKKRIKIAKEIFS